jgi:hypothetical protein
MNITTRLLGVSCALMGAVLAGSGVAAADDNPWIPHPGTLDVLAVTIGGTTFAVVTNSTSGYVCVADPEGTPLGAADEYGQAIVGATGFAAFAISSPDVEEVTITCGPRYSEWSEDGSATPLVLG